MLNREILLRNSTFFDEEKENKDSVSKLKSSSNVINSVLSSELSKSLFKTCNKRKFGEPINYSSLENKSSQLSDVVMTNLENGQTDYEGLESLKKRKLNNENDYNKYIY